MFRCDLKTYHVKKDKGEYFSRTRALLRLSVIRLDKSLPLTCYPYRLSVVGPRLLLLVTPGDARARVYRPPPGLATCFESPPGVRYAFELTSPLREDAPPAVIAAAAAPALTPVRSGGSLNWTVRFGRRESSITDGGAGEWEGEGEARRRARPAPRPPQRRLVR
ncbi:hypothetical protein EVAR_44483_1 [Eumeta japonica]|uniref:Uncharacterized protein n=1 Tax=Eumeta variegata TaxID=151549 RepID=A0A4C1WJB5_EUMVA|nr:hypothetical protein EVAR_44483_1 [Eumeta japonica]